MRRDFRISYVDPWSLARVSAYLFGIFYAVFFLALWALNTNYARNPVGSLVESIVYATATIIIFWIMGFIVAKAYNYLFFNSPIDGLVGIVVGVEDLSSQESSDSDDSRQRLGKGRITPNG